MKNMKMLRQFGFGLALMAGFSSSRLLAQSTTDSATSPAPQGTESQASIEASLPVTEQTVEQTSQKQYVSALNGAGLISMDSISKVHFLAGATISGGWDSNPNNLGNGASSSVYTISPYIGAQASTSRTQFLLQYQPTISRYSGYASDTMHVASAKFLGSLNERWRWTVNANGSHGQDSVRFLSPSQSVNVGDVPGNGPNSASYLANAGTVTDIDGGMELLGELSPRDSLRFRIANSFDSIPALHENSSVATSNVNFLHSIKPSLSVLGYQQISQYYGSLTCTTFGGGAGLHWQPRENTYLSLSAGPQIDTPSCKAQQGFSYSVSFSTRLPGKSQVYIQAAREPVTGYLGPGLWQDGFTGGYRRQLKRSNAVAFDLGFVHSSTLKNVSSNQGLYLDSSYTHFLHRALSLVFSYRSFVGSSGQTDFSRNIVLVSVSWTANARNLLR